MDGSVFQKKIVTVANESQLDRIRCFITDAVHLFLERNLLDELILAVDEAVANVVEHAYQKSMFDHVEQVISLEVEAFEERVLVRVMDKGESFNPLLLPPVDLEKHYKEAKQDGLGVHMIRELVDSWSYSPVNAGVAPLNEWNVLTLFKYARVSH